MKHDPLVWWMELFFVDFQNPATDDPGWRRYSSEAMLQEYGTRLTGEPIIHDAKAFNEAMKIRPKDPNLDRVKAALKALPVEQYNAIFAKYWYIGAYYSGLVFDKPPGMQKWGDGQVKERRFTDADRAEKVGQALSTFERNLKLAKDALYPALGLKRERAA